MKRIPILILMTMIIILSGCSDNTEKKNEELWNVVVDTEFSAVNFMGESMFFYERDSVKYCDFWMSGSGVPAIYFHTSTVEFNEDGNIVMEVPNAFIDTNALFDFQTFEEVIVEYTDEKIYLDGVQYEDLGWNSRDQALDWFSIETD